MPLSPLALRRQFPIFGQQIDGHPLVYLDTAATAQKPQAVLDAMSAFYAHSNANAHRGMHVLAERATQAFENARGTVQRFLGAKRPQEVIFTKNATEAVNLVARGMDAQIHDDSAILLTRLEHHSNIVPWQMLAERTGAEILWADIGEDGTVQMDSVRDHLATGRVKLMAVTAQSNVLGVRTPIAELIAMAHAAGAQVLVDAAQAVAHGPLNVQELDCDFLVLSGHKLYGPMGIGVLYGKRERLEALPPFLGGGMMIHEVLDSGFTTAELPAKFEAGTQPVAEAVGLAAAIDWLTSVGWEDIAAHEQALMETAATMLRTVVGLRILGPQKDHAGCISFVVDNVHPHDLTEILGRQGICLRAGHHCAQVLHRKLGVAASTRLSVGVYTTVEDIISIGPAIAAAAKRLRG